MPSHDTPEIVSFEEIGRRLRMSTRSVARAVARGEVPSFTVGRRRLVPRPLFERLMRGELLQIENTEHAGAPEDVRAA